MESCCYAMADEGGGCCCAALKASHCDYGDVLSWRASGEGSA